MDTCTNPQRNFSEWILCSLLSWRDCSRETRTRSVSCVEQYRRVCRLASQTFPDFDMSSLPHERLPSNTSFQREASFVFLGPLELNSRFRPLNEWTATYVLHSQHHASNSSIPCALGPTTWSLTYFGGSGIDCRRRLRNRWRFFLFGRNLSNGFCGYIAGMSAGTRGGN